jgi:hypothetical protein
MFIGNVSMSVAVVLIGEKIDGRRSTKVRDDWGSERKLTVAFNLVGGATRGSSPITARSGQ